MEMVEGQELFGYTVDRYKLGENETKIIIQQILKTIKYIHGKGIMHRDLKPENIMINPKTKHIKLVDFGLSSYFEDFMNLHTRVGTPYYVAPEVLNGDYNKQVDIWSIGIIAYILLTGCPPFQSENIDKIYDQIQA